MGRILGQVAPSMLLTSISESLAFGLGGPYNLEVVSKLIPPSPLRRSFDTDVGCTHFFIICSCCNCSGLPSTGQPRNILVDTYYIVTASYSQYFSTHYFSNLDYLLCCFAVSRRKATAEKAFRHCLLSQNEIRR